MHRYGGGATVVLNLPFERGFEVLIESAYQTMEDKYFMRWSLEYQKEMTYTDFKNKLHVPSREQFLNPPEDEKEEDIIDTVKNILNMRV